MLLLELVGEDVVVAPPLVVQERADAQQELFRLRQARRIAAAPQQRRIAGGRYRPRRRDVAKRAGRLLYVGLELIQRGIEPRVAGVDEPLQRLEDVGARRGDVERVEQLPVERRVARHQTRVQQRQQELRVVHFQLGEVARFADLVTDDEPGVPQRMQQVAEKPLLRLAEGAAEKDEQIDVRVGTKVAPAIAAQRNQRNRGAGRVRRRRQPLQLVIDVSGIALERRHRAFTGQDVAPRRPPCLLEEPGRSARQDRTVSRHGDTVHLIRALVGYPL